MLLRWCSLQNDPALWSANVVEITAHRAFKTNLLAAIDAAIALGED